MTQDDVLFGYRLQLFALAECLVLWLGSSRDVFVGSGGELGGGSVGAGEERSRSWRVNFHSNGRGDLLVAAAEGEEVLLERVEVGEVVGGEDLALDDREVDLGLVEPAGVDRGVDEDQVRPGALEAVDRALAAVRGAVVDDHEHALRLAVGLAGS